MTVPEQVAQLCQALPLDKQVEVRLFHAILKRRSNRAAFEAGPVPPPLVVALCAAAADERVGFHDVVGGDLQAVADLIDEGYRLQFSNKLFRPPLAAWMRPNVSRRRDGITGGLGTGITGLKPSRRTLTISRRPRLTLSSP
jgi:hypothetical protein